MIKLDFAVIKVWGKDADRYLNSRLSGEINSRDFFMPNFALDHTGRIEGFFRVLKRDDYFLISLETDESIESQIQSLFKYKVSEKINFEILNERIFHSVNELSPKPLCMAKRTEVVGFDYLLSAHECIEIKYSNIDDNAFTESRIAGNQPLFFKDIEKGERLFCLTSSDLLPKIGKCYVGHEAVEKALAVGKPPYLILPYFINEQVTISKGTEIFDISSGSKIGKIISFYSSFGGFCKVKNNIAIIGIKVAEKVIPLKLVGKSTNS